MPGKLLPGGNVFLRVMPHKMTKNEAHGCLESWVKKAVHKIENGPMLQELTDVAVRMRFRRQ